MAFTMSNTDKYISAINEIAGLYSEEKRRHDAEYKNLEKKFSIFCEELKPLYHQAIADLYDNHIAPFLKRYPFLDSNSFLAITGKERKETCHSLFLKYILNSQCKIGSSVLMDLCKAVGHNDEWINGIKHQEYIVNDEFSTGWQRKASLSYRRFDLLLQNDTADKWIIVIENKIDSKVRSKNGNQLAAYREFCERNFSDYSHRLYILLSLRPDNRTVAQEYCWEYADYYLLFNILLKYSEDDHFVKDYLTTLFSLLFQDIEIPEEEKRYSLSQCQLFINRIILNKN